MSGRCQLFDQFQDRMSQHAVKVDFLQRVHRLNTPVRRGAHTQLKKTLKVSLLVPVLLLWVTTVLPLSDEVTCNTPLCSLLSHLVTKPIVCVSLDRSLIL